MNYLQKSIITFLGLSYVALNVSAQESPDILRDTRGKTVADLFWETNPLDQWNLPNTFALKELPTAEEKNSSRKAYADWYWSIEKYRKNIWDWGIYFWKTYPSDVRRFEWFKRAANFLPLFFKDATEGARSQVMAGGNYKTDIDLEAYYQWKKEYEQMRKQYFNSGISEDEEILFRYNEFNADIIGRFVYPDYRGGKKLDLEYVKTSVKEFAPYFVKGGRLEKERFTAKGKHPLINVFTYLELYPHWYGLDRKEDLLPFFQSIAQIPVNEIAEHARKKAELFLLLGNPFNIRHKDIEGKMLDTEKMKKKLVYLDFWSTGCVSCIAMMPHLKELRDKYKSKGFEVVSICTNREKDREQVLNIYNRVGADWPLLLIGGNGPSNVMGGLAKEIWNRYGFTGVPKLFLLDENRNVIGYMVAGANLEKILEERLK